jgi:Flp pilus assembly protein protease CpaA
MKEYLFLFCLSFVYLVFASIHDIRKKEVANWLSFSLLAFVFSYRLFYSIQNNDYSFLFFGIIGFTFFLIIGYSLYYIRAYGGGDVKLLFGIGAGLPFYDYYSTIYLSLSFLFLLMLVGMIYSLIYSIFLVFQKFDKFKLEFKRKWKIRLFYIGIFVMVLGIVVLFFDSLISYILFFIGFLSCFYVYIHSLDRLMISWKSWDKLTEGDWIEKSIKLGNIIINPSPDGLSKREIGLIRKFNKKVYVKDGIPFVPAILLSYLIMLLFYSFLERLIGSFLF